MTESNVELIVAGTLLSTCLLRDVTIHDIPTFFPQQLDESANHMAAFTAKHPSDEAAFLAHWAQILGDNTIINKTILLEGQVAGHIASFEQFGQQEITYWLGRPFWGQGLATQALSDFLSIVRVRPLYARAVKDNLASLRVLEKCGFMISGYNRDFANARNEVVEEVILRLDDNQSNKAGCPRRQGR